MQFTYKRLKPGEHLPHRAGVPVRRRQPVPPQYACSDKPYMLKSQIEQYVNDPEWAVIVIYADGELRKVASFRTSDGLMAHTNFKRFSTDGNPHPNGIAMSEFHINIVKQLSGGKAYTQDPDVARKAYYDALGVWQEPTPPPGS